jgi:hypothetical protein
VGVRHCSIALTAALTAAVLTLAPAPARADGGDATSAEFMFQQAMKLMEKGKYEDACPRFEESQRLDPGVGTLLYLADCYEKVGRTATAWATFHAAEDAARNAGHRVRQLTAQKRAATLLPKLSKLMVTVPAATETPELTVRRDGAPLARVVWGTGMPVDPGPHEIVAEAPGKLPWKTTVTVARNKDVVEVSIPALADAPLPPPPSSPPPSQASTPTPIRSTTPAADQPSKPTQRIAALVTGGAGVAAMGVSVVLGFAARARFNESASYCLDNFCDQTGVALRDGAKTTALAGTIVFVAGATAAAAGAVLWFTAPSPAAKRGKSGDERTTLRIGLGFGAGFIEGRY